MTEVSGIVGNTQQAAAEATVAREATKKAWQEQIFTHVVIGFILLIVSYLLLTSLEWTFAWKLLAGIALIYAGGKIATVSAKLKWYWPNIIRGVGFGIIVLSLLQSGFAQMIGTGVNKVEQAATNFAATGTTKSVMETEAERKARADELRLQSELKGIEEGAKQKEIAKDAPLTRVAFTTKTIGTFEPFIVKSGTMFGPINSYKDTCPFWSKSGFGMIEIYTRPDTTSEPVLAELNDNYSIKKKGHQGATAQLFFKALEGDIQIEFERRVKGTCK
jgi:hypothetical protein